MLAQAMESRPRTEGKVNESRAAALLGLSTQKLRRLSVQAGIGHPNVENGGAELVFTYAELHRLCRLVAESGGGSSF
jgi:hypothetical protein